MDGYPIAAKAHTHLVAVTVKEQEHAAGLDFRAAAIAPRAVADIARWPRQLLRIWHGSHHAQDRKIMARKAPPAISVAHAIEMGMGPNRSAKPQLSSLVSESFSIAFPPLFCCTEIAV